MHRYITTFFGLLHSYKTAVQEICFLCIHGRSYVYPDCQSGLFRSPESMAYRISISCIAGHKPCSTDHSKHSLTKKHWLSSKFLPGQFCCLITWLRSKPLVQWRRYWENFSSYACYVSAYPAVKEAIWNPGTGSPWYI